MSQGAEQPTDLEPRIQAMFSNTHQEMKLFEDTLEAQLTWAQEHVKPDQPRAAAAWLRKNKGFDIPLLQYSGWPVPSHLSTLSARFDSFQIKTGQTLFQQDTIHIMQDLQIIGAMRAQYEDETGPGKYLDLCVSATRTHQHLCETISKHRPRC